MDIISTKLTNTLTTDPTSIASINCHSKKVRHKIDCYIFHTVSLMIILLLVIGMLLLIIQYLKIN